MRRQRPSTGKGALRIWLTAFAASIAAIAVLASSALAVPANFWGVVPQSAITTEQLQRLKRGGVTNIRLPIPWGSLQPVEGNPIDWSGIDGSVARASEAGITVLPYIFSAPEWLVPSEVVDPSIGARAPRNLPIKTPAQSAAWTTFLQEAVGRYGPGGKFWQANPQLPERSIRTWQIWNEPNFMYFAARPNPKEYGQLVKVSYSAIHAVDPGGKIVLGGLFVRPKQAENKNARPRRALFATEFLQQMYKQTPGIKSKFVGIALHPYSTAYQQLSPDIEAVREVLKNAGDPNKSIWITELGWSSHKPSAANGHNSFEKGTQGQATQLKGAYGLLTKNQAKWRIKSVYWYSIDDNASVCNFCDGSGLFGPGFKPKPAWSAFVHFTGGSVG